MKKFITAVVFAIFNAFTLTGQLSEHVIIISVDSLRPGFYLDPFWGMINLQQMKKEGVSAWKVDSKFPTVTCVNHTTIMTGELHGDHGILYNYPLNPKGQSSDWYWYAKDIKAPTLWEAAKTKGMTTAAVNWPVSVPEFEKRWKIMHPWSQSFWGWT